MSEAIVDSATTEETQEPTFADYEAQRRHEIYGTPKPEPVVAEPAKEQEAVTESKGEEKTEPGEPESEHKGLPPALREELKKLRDERRTLRAELEELKRTPPAKQEAPQVKSEPKPEAKPEASGKPIAPKISDFTTLDDYEAKHAEYVEKLTDWKLEQRDAANAKEAEKKANERTIAEMQTAWEQRVTQAETSNPDIRKQIDAVGTRVSAIMAHAIRSSEIGPDIVKYLHEHPDETSRIAQMRFQLEVGREIGKIEALVNKPPETVKTATRVLPSPPTALGNSASIHITKTPRELAEAGDFTAYELARRKQR